MAIRSLMAIMGNGIAEAGVPLIQFEGYCPTARHQSVD